MSHPSSVRTAPVPNTSQQLAKSRPSNDPSHTPSKKADSAASTLVPHQSWESSGVTSKSQAGRGNDAFLWIRMLLTKPHKPHIIPTPLTKKVRLAAGAKAQLHMSMA